MKVGEPGGQAVELSGEDRRVVRRRGVAGLALAGEQQGRGGTAQLVLGTGDDLQPGPQPAPCPGGRAQTGESEHETARHAEAHSASVSL